MMQMRWKIGWKWLRRMAVLCIAFLLAPAVIPATKKLAVVVTAGNKLSDLPFADLTNLCKGVRKTWPDGRSFSLEAIS
jgi:hypothetical protein